MTQGEFGDKIGKNQKQVSLYETGRTIPHADVLVDMARALDTTTDWLLGLTDQVTRPVRGETELSAVEREVLEMLRRMRPSERLKAVEVLKVL